MSKNFFHLTEVRALPMGEYVKCYSNVINIIENVEHNIESSDYEALVSKVVSNYGLLRELKRKIMASELTREVSRLHATRVECVRHLRHFVKSYPLSVNPELSNHLFLLDNWFRAHAAVLPDGRQGAVTQSLLEFEDELTNSIQFIEAIEALGISEVTNKLMEANRGYIKVYNDRSVLMGGKNEVSVDANKLKRETLHDLKMLINSISIQAALNPDSCHALVRALKAESNRNRTIVLRAKTLRRLAKLENEGVSANTATAIHIMPDVEGVEAMPAAVSAEEDINITAEAKPRTVAIDTPKAQEEDAHQDPTGQSEEDKKIS